MIVKLIENQTFTNFSEMKGNRKNVFFERLEKCCQRLKIVVGTFYLPLMERRKKSAIIFKRSALSVFFLSVTGNEKLETANGKGLPYNLC